jgi:hypothetical protein
MTAELTPTFSVVISSPSEQGRIAMKLKTFALLANGMYKKPIELLAKEVHYEPLPVEIRVAIIAAWRRGSALPQATIDGMTPARIT